MELFGADVDYLREAAVRGAHRLGLRLPATCAEAARALGLPETRRLAKLLDALVALGAARRDGEVFHGAFPLTPARGKEGDGNGSRR